MAIRKKHDEAFYRDLVAEYKRSGKPQREFAAERGIPPGTLSSWCFKLRERDAVRAAQACDGGVPSPTPRRSRQTTPLTSPAPSGSPFLPVRLVPGSEPRSGLIYEVVLAKGTVRLPADFDPVRVGALLRSLEVVC